MKIPAVGIRSTVPHGLTALCHVQSCPVKDPERISQKLQFPDQLLLSPPAILICESGNQLLDSISALFRPVEVCAVRRRALRGDSGKPALNKEDLFFDFHQVKCSGKILAFHFIQGFEVPTVGEQHKTDDQNKNHHYDNEGQTQSE